MRVARLDVAPPQHRKKLKRQFRVPQLLRHSKLSLQLLDRGRGAQEAEASHLGPLANKRPHRVRCECPSSLPSLLFSTRTAPLPIQGTVRSVVVLFGLPLAGAAFGLARCPTPVPVQPFRLTLSVTCTRGPPPRRDWVVGRVLGGGGRRRPSFSSHCRPPGRPPGRTLEIVASAS